MKRFPAIGAWILVTSWAATGGAQMLLSENGTGTFVGGEAGSDVGAIAEAARLGQSIAISERAGGPGSSAPERHVVRPGDTLWGICGMQLRNPWLWPQVWSLNPDITNPHWIYPGQVVRLRRSSGQGGTSAGPSQIGPAPGGTVFFRTEGYLDTELPEAPGRIEASWEDEMILSYPDLVYVRFEEGFPVEPGQQYTIYRLRETVYDIPANEDEEPRDLGRVVEILGTISIVSFDADARLARARIIESISPIERGDPVGPIERNYIISQPTAAQVDLDGQIVATFRPIELIAHNFVVFINRGYDDGVRDGNRFQVIRSTDHYLETIGEPIPEDLPYEWVGECHVLDARRTASTCYVTGSRLDLAIGDHVTLTRGQ